MSNSKTTFFGRLKPQDFKKDLFGALTTAVVSLPMAVAFGVASGIGPQAGLYGAIIVGFFAAMFGGTSTLISEPTGPMTVLITAVVVRHTARYPENGLAIVFTIIMVAGLIQILFGVFKLGRYFTMMPYSVISGFMSGIGLLLVFNQLPLLLGASRAGKSVYDSISQIPELLGALPLPELALSAMGILLLFATPKAWGRRVPPQLIVLVIGGLLTYLVFEPGQVRTIGNISLGFPRLIMPRLVPSEIVSIITDAAILGVLGSIDSSLTAMIADSLTREHHNPDRELIGQGIGNMVSGLFGGLPGAGATMGTVVNIQTGARSPLSALMRSGILILVVSLLSPLLQYIPRVVLAAIAVKVGFNILDWSFLGRAHKISRTATLIMYSVLLLTVFVDLLVAVAVGVFIANILTIEQLSEHPSTKVRTIDPSGDPVVLNHQEQAVLEKIGREVILFHLSGPMIFGVAQAIAREAAALRDDVQVLILDLTEVVMLSTTVALGIENLVLEALSSHTRVFVCGASREVREKLQRTELPETGVIFYDTRIQALEEAQQHCCSTEE